MDTVGALGSVVGIALIVLGLIGVVFPALPGPVLIWVGIAVWSASNGFVIGWPWLIGLLVLVVASWVSGHLVSATLSRRAGASWWGWWRRLWAGLSGRSSDRC
ncbi:MAG: DUF456 family protein [Dehalococcoidia bacterium]|nr:DUF456 family protein [Dehalococcoidia bacterium]